MKVRFGHFSTYRYSIADEKLQNGVFSIRGLQLRVMGDVKCYLFKVMSILSI